MSNSTAANVAYSKVGNLAGQLGSIDATVVNAALAAGGVARPPFVEREYTAFAPTGLVGTATTLRLVNTSAGATTPYFSLPNGSVVIGAQALNNGATLTSGSAATLAIGYTGNSVSYVIANPTIAAANITTAPAVVQTSRQAGLWGVTGGDGFYVLPSADLTAGDLKVIFRVLVPV